MYILWKNSPWGKCNYVLWKVWERSMGEKMFNAIVQNMEEAREKGDLVSTNLVESQREQTGFDGFN